MGSENEAEVWVTVCPWNDDTPAAKRHRTEMEQIQNGFEDKIDFACDEKLCFCMCKYHTEKFKDIEDERLEIAALRDEVAELKKAMKEQKECLLRLETLLIEKWNEKLG